MDHASRPQGTQGVRRSAHDEARAPLYRPHRPGACFGHHGVPTRGPRVGRRAPTPDRPVPDAGRRRAHGVLRRAPGTPGGSRARRSPGNLGRKREHRRGSRARSLLGRCPGPHGKPHAVQPHALRPGLRSLGRPRRRGGRGCGRSRAGSPEPGRGPRPRPRRVEGCRDRRGRGGRAPRGRSSIRLDRCAPGIRIRRSGRQRARRHADRSRGGGRGRQPALGRASSGRAREPSPPDRGRGHRRRSGRLGGRRPRRRRGRGPRIASAFSISVG